MGGDPGRARALRADLRRAEQAWDEVLASFADQVPESTLAAVVVPQQAGPLVPIREQVHHALTLLSVPSSPKLITAVHEALLAGEMVGARLTYLRRDEERSFRASPH